MHGQAVPLRLSPVLLLVLLTCLPLAPARPSAAPQPAPRRPNILFIFADDHTRQALSAYRHPLRLVETPNLDRLAREGMLFERAMVPNSICGPSRAVILTGKYSHLNGFYRNGNRFDGAQPTFPKMLQKAGYQTAVVGKWHLESDPTGFDHWHILPGQGIYYNPPMIRNGEKVVHQGYTTDVITDLSIEWLKQRDRSKPFMLMSQHKAPHREWAPALRHLGWNGDRTFPEPETLFDDYAGRGRAEREQDMTLAKTFTDIDAKLTAPRSLTPEQRAAWDAYYEPRNEAFRKANPTGRDLVRWRYQRYLHDYLGTVLAVDESVGRLLKYLDDEGLAENTLVVYSSDQGFFLGEHGWFDKRWIYEESLTTPLLVRWPGVARAGSRSPSLVSILDLPETFLEAAGLPVPPDMQGRSLLPVLKGTAPADWRTSFYYHYYEFPGPHSVRKHYGVVTDRYKLFHFYEPDVDYWSLIDRRTDPHELRNVYGDPAHAAARRELTAELARLRRELQVPETDPPASLAPAPRAAAPSPPDPQRPPNVVLVLADDLGWTDLGCFGSRFYETPNIDRLCAQGMKFTQAYANGPNCAPTRASLLTGRYTPRHGVTQVGAEPRGRAEDRKLVEIPSRTALGLEEITFAEALGGTAARPGYTLASIGKWHLGTGAAAPPGQGFHVTVADNFGGTPGYFAPFRTPLRGIGAGREGEYLTDRLTDEAVRFIEEHRDRPFLLYLSHYAVHSPLQAKQELVARFAAKPKDGPHTNAVYAAMIQSLDESVGRVMETLDRLDLAEKTVVIFTSDNGGWAGATSNQPLRGYKGMLYEGGIRVPLIVRWPGVVRPGGVSSTPVISLDLYPTLLDIAGRPAASGQVLDGESLVPLLRGTGELTRSALYWHFPHYLEAGPNVPGTWRTTPAGAVRRGDYKLIEFFEDGRLELFDLRRDAGERHDLSRRLPERAAALRRELHDWRDAVGARIPRPPASARRTADREVVTP